MVLYLKYRPQTTSDLFGQESVLNGLRLAIQNNKLSHAYLFAGPRGVGKTSTARILAKMVNCTSKNDVPCNSCEACISITNGSCMDVIEIDAASNRGIDDIRDLREKIKLAPSSLKKKVYIIDEVHMLTNEAFNALLKTLEEPPAHVLFIMATTEVHKVPQTILSRVTRMDFREGTIIHLVAALKRVVDGEKIDIDEEALILLAKKSDGSFRDSIKLLDQLSSHQKKITVSLVEETLKGGTFQSLLNLTKALSQKDASESLRLLSQEAEIGTNIKDYLSSLTDLFRSLLLIKQGVADLIKNTYSEEKFAELEKISQNFSNEELIKNLNLFQQAYEKLKVSSIPSLPLEIAVVESCQAKTQDSRLKTQEVVILGAERTPESFDSLQDISGPNPGQSRIMVRQEVKEATTSNDLITLRDKWSYILEVIKPYNFSLEAMLHSVALDSVDGDLVVLKVPYSFHQRILETPRNRDLLESVLADVLQKPVKVGCVLEQRPVRVEELANIELAADDEVIKLASEIFNS